MLVGLAAAVVREDEGLAVYAFGDGRVLFMCADDDTVEGAVVLVPAVVGAGGNGAGNAAVRFLRFHSSSPNGYRFMKTGFVDGTKAISPLVLPVSRKIYTHS